MQQPGGQRYKQNKRDRVNNQMSVLYKEGLLEEGQFNPWAGEFRVGGRICQVGTEGCWENLEARSALICKICTSGLCPGVLKSNSNWTLHVPLVIPNEMLYP